MRAEEIRPVDLTTGAGYDSQWALMRDLFVWLDLRLYYFTRTINGSAQRAR